MKILFTADWHLNSSPLYGKINGKTGLSTRFEDVLASLNRMISYCDQTGIKVIFNVGDLYKNRHPNSVEGKAFARIMRTLADHGISLYIEPGNHDDTNTYWGTTSLDALGILEVPNFHLIDEPRELYFNSDKEPGVTLVVAMPWVSNRFKVKNRKKWLKETIQTLLKKASTVPNITCKILTCHESVKGAVVGPYQFVKDSEVLDPEDLCAKEFDFVMLGHIHKAQKIEPNLYYCGSIDRVDFGERKDPKGFWVVDTNSKEIQFFKLPTRPFVQVDIDLLDGYTEEGLIKELQEYTIKDSIVKVAIKGLEKDIKKINTIRIKDLLEQNNVSVIMAFEVKREHKTRIQEMKPEINKETMLYLYLKKMGYDPIMLDKVYAKGKEFLDETTTNTNQ
jgi:exonuclease SbcD